MTTPEDVTIDRLYQARCHTCAWKGGLYYTAERANAERRLHLNSHVIKDITPDRGQKT